MATLTINPAASDDEFYRYQMSRLLAKPDGRNKQRRTALENLEEVSLQLRRSPALLRTFLARSVGTTGGCDRKGGTPAHFLSGHHTADVLQRHVAQFCTRLIVCPACGDCGTRLYVTSARSGGGAKKKAPRAEDLRLRLGCGACGFDGEAVEQDARLAKACADDAPPARAEDAAVTLTEEDAKAKDDSNGRKKKKKEKKEKKGADPTTPEADPNRNERKAKGEKGKKTKPQTDDADSDDDVEWFTDLSPEAVQARRNEALGGAPGL